MTKIFSFRYANEVLVGDELMINGVDGLIREKVISVTDIEMQGNHYCLKTEFYKTRWSCSWNSHHSYVQTLLIGGKEKWVKGMRS